MLSVKFWSASRSEICTECSEVGGDAPGSLKLPASLAALPFVTALLVRFDMMRCMLQQ